MRRVIELVVKHYPKEFNTINHGNSIKRKVRNYLGILYVLKIK